MFYWGHVIVLNRQDPTRSSFRKPLEKIAGLARIRSPIFGHGEPTSLKSAVVKCERQTDIARGLRRSASTISREITRHGGRTQYRANAADQQAWESAVRPKPCRLATHSELQQMVASVLHQNAAWVCPWNWIGDPAGSVKLQRP
jgi:hypothetical protein